MTDRDSVIDLAEVIGQEAEIGQVSGTVLAVVTGPASFPNVPAVEIDPVAATVRAFFRNARAVGIVPASLVGIDQT